MAIYDGPPRGEPVEEKHISANYVGRATKVFAIHMAALIVLSILLGIFVNISAMWIFGGCSSFFMVGWHLVAIQNAFDKERKERNHG